MMKQGNSSYRVDGTTALDVAFEEQADARIIQFPMNGKSCGVDVDIFNQSTYRGKRATVLSSGYATNADVEIDPLSVRSVMTSLRRLNMNSYVNREVTTKDRIVLIGCFVAMCILMTL